MKRKASGTKTKGITDTVQVQYNSKHWLLLEDIRAKAIGVMEKLANNGIQSIIYGSITRGDISETSDIDLFIP